MKSPALPLVALSLLLGACSTPPSPSAFVDTAPAVPAGTKVTKWGELPSYEPAGHRFTGVHAPDLGKLEIQGTAKLDIMVNPDGTVEDVAVFQSSGDPVVDEAAAASFKNARYSLRLGPNDPAPYVVRFTMTIKTTVGPEPMDMTNYSQLGPQPAL